MSKLLEIRPLFKECVEALETTLLPDEKSDELSVRFLNMFPITRWGKIDWTRIDKKISIGCDPRDIFPALEQLLHGSVDKNCYIEWSRGGIPIISANLDKIIEHFDDVTCVAFEKFIFNPEQGYIVEVLPSDEMTVDIVDINFMKQLSGFFG